MKNDSLQENRQLKDTSDKCDSIQGHLVGKIIQGDFSDGFKRWFLQSREKQTEISRNHRELQKAA